MYTGYENEDNVIGGNVGDNNNANEKNKNQNVVHNNDVIKMMTLNQLHSLPNTANQWSQKYIDDWFQEKNIVNEFFAIVNCNEYEHNNNNNNQCKKNSITILDRHWWLSYITNIVHKIKWHINLST